MIVLSICSTQKCVQTSILEEMVQSFLIISSCSNIICLCVCVCVFICFAGGQGAWSDDNCEKVQCDERDSNYTCCECHTYGHFGLLLVSIITIIWKRKCCW